MTKDKNILINNVYHMLSYAFQTLNQEQYEDVATESFDEMYDLLAAILSKGIGLQIKQGLYREYVNQVEELKVFEERLICLEPSKGYLRISVFWYVILMNYLIIIS